MYAFSYVDKGALAQAKLNNLERDLHLTGTDFNTAVSILSVGYVLMQIPSNMLLTRVRPSSYLSLCAIVWSVVSGELAVYPYWSGFLIHKNSLHRTCSILRGVTWLSICAGHSRSAGRCC